MPLVLTGEGRLSFTAEGRRGPQSSPSLAQSEKVSVNAVGHAEHVEVDEQSDVAPPRASVRHSIADPLLPMSTRCIVHVPSLGGPLRPSAVILLKTMDTAEN